MSSDTCGRSSPRHQPRSSTSRSRSTTTLSYDRALLVIVGVPKRVVLVVVSLVRGKGSLEEEKKEAGDRKRSFFRSEVYLDLMMVVVVLLALLREQSSPRLS